MNSQFATFTPIEYKSSKEAAIEYFKNNNVVFKEDYLNNYFNINPAAKNTNIENSTKTAYNIAELAHNIPDNKSSNVYDIDSKDIGEKIILYFQNKGLTRAQAAGIAGNLQAESNFDTKAIGDNGTSYGLAQWHKTRKSSLENFAHINNFDLNSLNTQLEFLWKELQTTHKLALQELLKTTTVQEAAKVFAHKFEKMKHYNVEREEYAWNLFNKK